MLPARAEMLQAEPPWLPEMLAWALTTAASVALDPGSEAACIYMGACGTPHGSGTLKFLHNKI